LAGGVALLGRAGEVVAPGLDGELAAALLVFGLAVAGF
jgi:hypothetical protein